MRRRDFLTLLGGAVAWPVTVPAQQTGRMRRVRVLMSIAADDPEGERRLIAFVQGLQQFGWSTGHNVQIDTRWAAGDIERMPKLAQELVALTPDVILAAGAPTVGPLQRVTRAIPIVFAIVTDPVGAGYVDSLARPGGNTTGFMNTEYEISVKWLELLKEIAPRVTPVGVVRDPAMASGAGQLGALQGAARSFGVETSPISVRDAPEIERSIAAFARSANDGLIVTGSALAFVHRDLIVVLAARHKLPAVYWDRALVVGGGLISYGADLVDQCRKAAGYVDRILRGEKAADLPVQAPTKYELVINLEAAKALGLTVPDTLLARVDGVTE